MKESNECRKKNRMPGLPCNPPLYSNVHSSLRDHRFCFWFCFLFHQFDVLSKNQICQQILIAKISWGAKTLSATHQTLGLAGTAMIQQANNIRCTPNQCRINGYAYHKALHTNGIDPMAVPNTNQSQSSHTYCETSICSHTRRMPLQIISEHSIRFQPKPTFEQP